MTLRVLQHPNPKLRAVCDAVDQIDEDLIAQMFETMYAAYGRGLAAPQIGILQRLFVMDATWKDGDKSPRAFVNPTITDQGGAQINAEACLSIADTSRRVARPAWIDLTWTGVDGRNDSARFEGFAAACICHEVDHLNGTLILDHAEAP